MTDAEKIRLVQSYLANVESYKKGRLIDLQRSLTKSPSIDPYDALKLFQAQIEVQCYHDLVSDLERILYAQE